MIPLGGLVLFIPLTVGGLEIPLRPDAMPQSGHEHRMTQFHGLVPRCPIALLLLDAWGRAWPVDRLLTVVLILIISAQILWIHACIVDGCGRIEN